MSDASLDARRELETIRELMERARDYRHPPAATGFVAGLAGLAGGLVTQRELAAEAPDIRELAVVWGAVFGIAFVAVVVFTSRAARREGKAFWSPLAKDVIHSLWPSLVAAAALSVALVRADRLALVAPVWLLAYGVGAVAAGAFASPVVRWLGGAFLAAGLLDLALGLPAGLVLAGTFGGLHLLYGAVLALGPRSSDAR